MEDNPKLRPLQAIPFQSEGEQMVCLRDLSGLSKKTVVLPPRAFFIAALCDGAHTVRDIQVEYMRRFGDLIFTEKVEELIRQLEDALLLEGERFEAHRRALAEEFARAAVRPASHSGSAYPSQPKSLRQMLSGFFEGEGGPGAIAPDRSGSGVAAIAAPHIDLRRGGLTYAFAYKELAERCAAETFVILGIAHGAIKGLFVPTDKDFATPLGVMRCDRDLAHDLMRRAGLQRSEDELLHLSEHSIEFQSLFLRHVFGASRPARIVPVLCGPILEACGEQTDPVQVEPIGNFVSALKEILLEQGDRVAVVASIDLSHVGRRFNDPTDLSPGLLARVEEEDRALLRHAEEVNAAAFFDANLRDGDRRHVCGFPALYVLLASTPARRGRLLHYAQSPEEETQSVVTFAAMVFEK